MCIPDLISDPDFFSIPDLDPGFRVKKSRPRWMQLLIYQQKIIFFSGQQGGDKNALPVKKYDLNN
jgi:hypothetical protein